MDNVFKYTVFFERVPLIGLFQGTTKTCLFFSLILQYKFCFKRSTIIFKPSPPLGNDKTASTEILDLDTLTSQTGPDLPGEIANGQAFTYNGTVYTIANNGKMFKLVDSGNSWEKIKIPAFTKMGTRRVYPALVVSSSVLH